ncbi:MAG: DUF2207 domain-containing protein [Cyanothece sp. SIO2G6]|nr:DUF2207 domain-containing protein [Cyanothece sp. SIO2G6]
MPPQDAQEQDIRELLTDFQAETRKSLADLQSELTRSRQELQDEVKRWDTRFFEFSRDSLNRANTLIASATISVIAGVILLLLRQN